MEYILQNKFINWDFVPSKIANAKKIVIVEDRFPNIIQLKGKNDLTIIEIPLENIKEIEIICQSQYKKEDMLAQFVFIDERQRLRILRLNILDSQIDEVIHKITQLKGNDSHNTELKTCSQCGSNGSIESKFCAQCGNKFDFVCPHCGNLNPEESLFCPNCALGLKTKNS